MNDVHTHILISQGGISEGRGTRPEEPEGLLGEKTITVGLLIMHAIPFRGKAATVLCSALWSLDLRHAHRRGREGGRGKRKRPIRHPSVPPPVMELLHPLCGAAARPHCCACLSKHKHTQPLSYGSRVDGWFADLQQLEVALVPRRSRGPLSRPSLISHPTQHFNTIWPPHAQFSTLQ